MIESKYVTNGSVIMLTRERPITYLDIEAYMSFSG